MLLRLHQQSLLQPLSPVIRERPTPFPPSMPTELVTLRQLLKSRPHVIQQGTHSLQALLEGHTTFVMQKSTLQMFGAHIFAGMGILESCTLAGIN